MTNLIDPWVETLLELISITAKHVACCGFLLQDTGSNTDPFISKSDSLNAASQPCASSKSCKYTGICN